jgi:hypothetical protein
MKDARRALDVWPMADASNVRTYVAFSLKEAVRQRAREDYKADPEAPSYARDGDYFVRDRSTMRVYRISIDCYLRPEFVAGEPREVPVNPRGSR